MTKKEALIEFYYKIVLDFLEDYWKNVYEKREDERTWHQLSIYFDLFKPWAWRKDNSTPTGHGGLQCVLHPPREFWDTMLALYSLKVPEFLDDPRLAALVIVKTLENLLEGSRESIEGDFFLNFSDYQWSYLTKLACGEPCSPNRFLENPVLAACVMRMELVLAVNPKPFNEEDHERWKNAVEMWKKDVLLDFEKKISELEHSSDLEPFLPTMDEFSNALEYVF